VKEQGDSGCPGCVRPVTTKEDPFQLARSRRSGKKKCVPISRNREEGQTARAPGPRRAESGWASRRRSTLSNISRPGDVLKALTQKNRLPWPRRPAALSRRFLRRNRKPVVESPQLLLRLWLRHLRPARAALHSAASAGSAAHLYRSPARRFVSLTAEGAGSSCEA